MTTSRTEPAASPAHDPYDWGEGGTCYACGATQSPGTQCVECGGPVVAGDGSRYRVFLGVIRSIDEINHMRRTLGCADIANWYCFLTRLGLPLGDVHDIMNIPEPETPWDTEIGNCRTCALPGQVGSYCIRCMGREGIPPPPRMSDSAHLDCGGMRSQCERRCTCVSRAHEEAFRQWETGLQTTRPPIILPQECVTRRLDAAMDIQDLRRNADPDSEDPTDTAGVFMQTGHGRGSDMHDDPSTQELAPEAEPRAPPQPLRWSCNECGMLF